MSEARATAGPIFGYRRAADIAPDRVALAAGIMPARLAQIEEGDIELTRDEIIWLALVLGVAANDLRPGTTAPIAFPDGLTVDEKIVLTFGDASAGDEQ